MAHLACLKCKKFYRCIKNGYYFEEGMPGGSAIKEQIDPGTGWGPYKLFVGDLYECPDCKAQVITGWSNQPLAEHFQGDEYRKWRERVQPKVRIDDCGGAH